MLVSIDFPFLTAVTLAPLPRWAMISRSGRIVAKLMQDGFAGKAVKAVALNTLGLQFPGYRKHAGNIRQIDMKCRVETCDLRQPRKVLPGKTDHR